MIESNLLPDYYKDELPLFLSKLRALAFSSQRKAAEYVGLDPAQINRYEKEIPNNNVPDNGYVACLVQRIAELNSNTTAVQEELLALFNLVQIGQYRELKLQDWNKLGELVHEYLEGQRLKLLLKNFPSGYSTREKQIGLLANRIGQPNHHGFIAMEDEMNELIEYLKKPNAPWITVLVGLGGVGKTTLAHALAQKVIEKQLFDNVGWVSVGSANDFQQMRHEVGETVLDTENLFEELLKQLVPKLPRSPSATQPKPQVLLKRRFNELAHLIIIDNLETLADLNTLVAQLPPLTKPTKFLLTSRVDLNLSNIYQKRLMGLNQAQAIALMRAEAQVLHIKRIANADERLLENIYNAVDGNPLALRLVVGQARNRPIDKILAKLDQLGNHSEGNLFKFIYKDVWDNLAKQERHLLFSLILSTHHGADVAYLTAMNGLELEQAEPLLEQLAELNLISSNQAATSDELCYMIHSLTRAYLQELAHSSESSLFQQILEQAMAYLLAYQQKIDVLSSMDQALYIQIILTGLDSPELWQSALELLFAVAHKMEQSGVREIWVPVLLKGIQVSQSSNNSSAEGEFYFHLGTLRHRQGQYHDAAQAFADSAEIFADLGDSKNQARGVNRRAYIARLSAQLEIAEELVHLALRLLTQEPTASNDKAECTYSYLVLGTVELDRRQFELAVEHFQHALKLCPWQGESRLKAWCFTNLGTALRQLKRYDEAIGIYQQALKLSEQFNDSVHLAVVQMNLANIYMIQGQAQQIMSLYEEALSLYEPARTIFHQAEEGLHIAQINTNMGMAYTRLGLWDKAERYLRTSIDQYEELGIIKAVINTMDSFGWLYLDQGRVREAIAVFREAFVRLEEIKMDPRYPHLSKMLSESLQEGKDRLDQH